MGKICGPLQVFQVVDVHPVTGNVLHPGGVAIIYQAINQLRDTAFFYLALTA